MDAPSVHLTWNNGRTGRPSYVFQQTANPLPPVFIPEDRAGAMGPECDHQFTTAPLLGFAYQIVGWAVPTTLAWELVSTVHPTSCEPSHLVGQAAGWQGGPACFKLGAKHKKLQIERERRTRVPFLSNVHSKFLGPAAALHKKCRVGTAHQYTFDCGGRCPPYIICAKPTQPSVHDEG